MIIKNERGFSLIELMVSIAIGLLITVGLVELFQNNKLSYRAQDGLSRIQENGRFAQYFLSREIRMAGYTGCESLVNLEPKMLVSNPPANLTLTMNDAISGFESTGPTTWSPALPANLVGKVAPNTDVITIHKAGKDSVKITSNMSQPTSALNVIDRMNIKQNDIIIITDCDQADIFQVTNSNTAASLAHGSTGNVSPSLSKSYQTDAKVLKFEAFSFYVNDSGNTNLSGQPIFSLYFQDLNNVETEIVSGVESMQVAYGVDTTGDRNADTYQTASVINATNNWANVLSVRISLLLDSINETNATPRAYTFNNTTVNNPGDRLARQQWDYYITLRNRSS